LIIRVLVELFVYSQHHPFNLNTHFWFTLEAYPGNKKSCFIPSGETFETASPVARVQEDQRYTWYTHHQIDLWWLVDTFHPVSLVKFFQPRDQMIQSISK
jgi:hypothetical protein